MFQLTGGKVFNKDAAQPSKQYSRGPTIVKRVIGHKAKKGGDGEVMTKGMDVANVRRLLDIQHCFFGPESDGTGQLKLVTNGLDWIKSLIVDFSHPIWHDEEVKKALNLSISTFQHKSQFTLLVSNIR